MGENEKYLKPPPRTEMAIEKWSWIEDAPFLRLTVRTWKIGNPKRKGSHFNFSTINFQVFCWFWGVYLLLENGRIFQLAMLVPQGAWVSFWLEILVDWWFAEGIPFCWKILAQAIVIPPFGGDFFGLENVCWTSPSCQGHFWLRINVLWRAGLGDDFLHFCHLVFLQKIIIPWRGPCELKNSVWRKAWLKMMHRESGSRCFHSKRGGAWWTIQSDDHWRIPPKKN